MEVAGEDERMLFPLLVKISKHSSFRKEKNYRERVREGGGEEGRFLKIFPTGN